MKNIKEKILDGFDKVYFTIGEVGLLSHSDIYAYLSSQLDELEAEVLGCVPPEHTIKERNTQMGDIYHLGLIDGENVSRSKTIANLNKLFGREE